MESLEDIVSGLSHADVQGHVQIRTRRRPCRDLDFPGVIMFGPSYEEARRLLASALVDMAETNLLQGEPLPRPDPGLTDPEADLEEPIHLLLTATSRVELVPQSAAS